MFQQPGIATAQIDVSAANDDNFGAWDGWVHSRLRQLVQRTENLVSIRAWPSKLKSALPEDRCRGFYYMGIRKHSVGLDICLDLE